MLNLSLLILGAILPAIQAGAHRRSGWEYDKGFSEAYKTFTFTFAMALTIASHAIALSIGMGLSQ